MKQEMLHTMWVITDGAQIATIRVPFNAELIGLPLIVNSRAKARRIMREYPELAKEEPDSENPEPHDSMLTFLRTLLAYWRRWNEEL